MAKEIPKWWKKDRKVEPKKSTNNFPSPTDLTTPPSSSVSVGPDFEKMGGSKKKKSFLLKLVLWRW